jgi:hypothetical protein
MPWKPSDASSKTKKANTPKRKRQWRDVANSARARGLSDKDAIREADSVIRKGYKKRPHG